MLIEVEGIVERITYRSEETNYTVAKLRAKGRTSPLTVVGSLVSVSEGETLRVKGMWENHPKYGEQLKVISYEAVPPATLEGIERYLGSGLIKGIGPVTAGRLVSKFGEQTLDIIETDIERLKEVEGIGESKIRVIKDAWNKQKEIREIMLFLQSHGISGAYAPKILKHYGGDSIKILTENPYRLATDIYGIGFLTADRIAQKLGIPKESALRAEAGILYVLGRLSEEGHVYYPYEGMMEESSKTLGLQRETLARSIAKLALENKIVIEDVGEGEIKENTKAVYLPWFYASEAGIAECIKALLRSPKSAVKEIETPLEHIQKNLGIELSEMQKEAVVKAVSEKMLVITGGPGVGKTTVINSILKLYLISGLKVLLAAPTGRAAKRMSELTGHEAKTIHRLLEWSPKDNKFRRNEGFPLTADLVIIDETSMVDTLLMHNLLKAMPLEATLILVGDVEQLPSVGPGSILRDIIESGTVCTIRLNEIFRQSGESMIVLNAHRVNRGEMPEAGEDHADFFFFQTEEPEAGLKKILELCGKRIPERFGLDPVSDIQVLTPMHKGIIGVSRLNRELQQLLNPSGEEFSSSGRTLKKGDKVMQIRNNYDKDVFNGDTGIIKAINMENHGIIVDFDGREVLYESPELEEIALAYAISVHKSQGCEYPAVIMPVLTEHYMMLQRNLLYTGITRGKRLVVLVGTKKALAIAIKNDKPRKRYTNLKNRLMH
jgi:exodeoxyribonuclease V alpha subunit